MLASLRKAIRLRQRPIFIAAVIMMVLLLLLKIPLLLGYLQNSTLEHLAKPVQTSKFYFNVYVNFPAQAYGLFFLSIFWGWINGTRDNNSHFYSFLTTNGFSRKQIFKAIWWERAWPILLLGGIYWGCLALIWTLTLSWPRLEMSLLQLVIIIITNLLINQAAWIAMTFVSLFFGNAIFSLLALAAFWWSTGQVIYYFDYPHFDLWDNFLYPMTDLKFWPLMTIYLIIIIGGTLSSYWLFQHFSGENLNEFFVIPQSRWPFSLVMLILLATVFYKTPAIMSVFLIVLIAVIILGSNLWLSVRQKRISFNFKHH